VLGHPEAAPAAGGSTVFIPVSTPGIGTPGHLFRTDGSVVLPLFPVYPDTLPSVAEVVGRLSLALIAARERSPA
jgi:formylmethanofuran dehydrogenase subunit B